MFPGWLQDFVRMIISNERSKGTRWSPTIRWSQLFDDPQLFNDLQPFDDPQLFDDQLEVWTLIIQKSTVILPSLMVLFLHLLRLKWGRRKGKIEKFLWPSFNLPQPIGHCNSGNSCRTFWLHFDLGLATWTCSNRLGWYLAGLFKVKW